MYFRFTALKFYNESIVRFLDGIPCNHLRQHPWLQQAFYVSLNDLCVKERIRDNQMPYASPWSFMLGQVASPTSFFFFFLHCYLFFSCGLWDASVKALCGTLWVQMLCDACVLCNCSTKHPWWQSDRHAFSHSTLSLYIVPRRDTTPGLSLRKSLMIPLCYRSC